ncbi:MAG: DNA repair protein RecN [Gemmatimonadetes bacterium]|nr:MAG: DNA repair protein RecN [Gemmatimonadota bacterium]
MLSELRVRNLATVADVTLMLGPGLNVLTGETGAGKSLLVDALALLLGERADTQALRPGAAKAVIEGVVEEIDPRLTAGIESLGLDVEDGRLVIRREVAAEGRSRAWVNGSPTTVKVLAQLGALLADLHGQHETQSLLRPDAQRDMLDAFAGAGGERVAVVDAHETLHALETEYRALSDRRDEVRRRADYLRHVAQEISQADPQPGEDAALDREAALLGEADAVEALAQSVLQELDRGDGAALHAVGAAERAVDRLEKFDPTVAAWRELLDGAYANLSELTRVVEQYANDIEHSPERLAEVETRRDVLGRLKQKYGTTVEAVLETLAGAMDELNVLDTADLDLEVLEAKRTAAAAALDAACDRLSAKRGIAAGRLTRAVDKLLPTLGLAGGRMTIELPALPQAGLTGRESVAFQVQLNQGMDPRPLGRVASGGELSRIMLALKVVLARHDRIQTLVFDEIDQGIGGEVAVQVGEALARVAQGRQVLVITHLPQIAGKADRHLVVAKGSSGGMATSDVSVIHGEDRVLEVARMLGDAESAAARRHAKELLVADS